MVFIGILVFSCKSQANVVTVGNNLLYAYLTNDAKYMLLPPDGIEKSLDMPQHLSASYAGQNYSLNAWVKADENGINMTLFNELGASMGEVSYRDGYINFSSPVFPKSIKPEYIIADFQLCFYSPILLSKTLEECGLSLDTSDNNRLIFNGKDLIIEINKTVNAVRIVNHLRGYSYTLEGDFS